MRPVHLGLLCAVLVACVSEILAQNVSTCLAACKTKGGNPTSGFFCDQYGQTQEILVPLDDDSCPYLCGAGIAYAGPCGCPNNCQENGGKGTCEAGVCKCVQPWSGADCSLFTCAGGFACSGHGSCVTGGMINGSVWADRCECAAGFTSYDCSLPVLPIPALPFGDLFPTQDPPYFIDDDYGDNHPVFNHTSVATLRISVDAASFEYIMTPAYAYNQSYFPANLTYDNGVVTQALTDVGFRIKGAGSREGTVKGWKLAFDQYNEDNRLFNLKSVGLKTHSVAGDYTLTHNFMAGSMFRALHVPYMRLGFTQLWINEVYYGVYLVLEDLNGDFLKSRFGDNKGNLYKVNDGWLSPLGNATMFKNDPGYELDRKGKKPWDDLNDASEAAASGNLTEAMEIINTQLFGRAMIVEDHAYNRDGFCYYGNNWWIYNLDGVMQYIPYDYDNTFGDWIPPAGIAVNIYLWGNATAVGRGIPRITRTPLLMFMVFANAGWRANFTSDYQALMGAIPQAKVNAYTDAIVAMVQASLDMNGLYAITWGNASVFTALNQAMTDFMTQRYAAVTPMLAVEVATTTTSGAATVTSTTGVEELTGSTTENHINPPADDSGKYLAPILVTLAVVAVVGVLVGVYVRRRKRIAYSSIETSALSKS